MIKMGSPTFGVNDPPRCRMRRSRSVASHSGVCGMRIRSFLVSSLVLLPCLTAAAPGRRAGPPLDDAAILATFDEVNGFDIETAKLGVIRGHSESVRELAAEVLRDHSMVLQMARDLAARKGIV